MQHKMGWHPSLPDIRDLRYRASMVETISLPTSIDLREICPEVYNQGPLGSCVSNAIAAFIQILQKKEAIEIFAPSRLFVYYNGRDQEGTVPIDAGETVRDGVKSIANIGVCAETDWPYDISQFTVKPPQNAYNDAKLTKAIKYYRVPQMLSQIQACLASGYPVIAGISVYESFETEESAQTGIINLPQQNEKRLGGHCILIVGYDDKQSRFLCLNSWGNSWGMQGYFTIEYDYIIDQNLCCDLWTIRTIS